MQVLVCIGCFPMHLWIGFCFVSVVTTVSIKGMEPSGLVSCTLNLIV